MRMKKIYKENIILSLLLLCIGMTLGKLLNWGYFELSKSISVIDALNVFITIGLTIYVARILDKRNRHEQFEIDLYVAKIEEIEKQIKSIEDLVQTKGVVFQQINTKIHVLNIAKNKLIDSINEYLKKKQYSFDDIKEKHKALKIYTTNTPIDNKDKSVVVKSGQATYSEERIAEIINVSYSLREEYFKLKVKLSQR